MADPVHSALVGGAGLILTSAASIGRAMHPGHPPTRTEQVAMLIVAALLFGGVYLLACAVWPYANCTRCDGSGKSRSPGRKAFRNCPRCKGTGRRRRFGRALLDRQTDRHNR